MVVGNAGGLVKLTVGTTVKAERFKRERPAHTRLVIRV